MEALTECGFQSVRLPRRLESIEGEEKFSSRRAREGGGLAKFGEKFAAKASEHVKAKVIRSRVHFSSPGENFITHSAWHRDYHIQKSPLTSGSLPDSVRAERSVEKYKTPRISAGPES